METSKQETEEFSICKLRERFNSISNLPTPIFFGRRARHDEFKEVYEFSKMVEAHAKTENERRDAFLIGNQALLEANEQLIGFYFS